MRLLSISVIVVAVLHALSFAAHAQGPASPQKVALAPNEKKTVSFRLAIRDLPFVGRDDKPLVEPGDFDVMIGGQTARLTFR